MLAKAESAAQIARVVAAMPAHGQVVGLVETARGIARLEEIASAPRVQRLAFGTLDYAIDLGLTDDDRGLLYLVDRQQGVDIIEAGFPIASQGDFEAVQAVAKEITESVVCGLARAGKADIDRAGEALKPAKRKRIHIVIATSDLHMKHKLRMSPDEVVQASVESVTLARQHADDVEWSAEEIGRAHV